MSSFTTHKIIIKSGQDFFNFSAKNVPDALYCMLKYGLEIRTGSLINRSASSRGKEAGQFLPTGVVFIMQGIRLLAIWPANDLAHNSWPA